MAYTHTGDLGRSFNSAKSYKNWQGPFTWIEIMQMDLPDSACVWHPRLCPNDKTAPTECHHVPQKINYFASLAEPLKDEFFVNYSYWPGKRDHLRGDNTVGGKSPLLWVYLFLKELVFLFIGLIRTLFQSISVLIAGIHRSIVSYFSTRKTTIFLIILAIILLLFFWGLFYFFGLKPIEKKPFKPPVVPPADTVIVAMDTVRTPDSTALFIIISLTNTDTWKYKDSVQIESGQQLASTLKTRLSTLEAFKLSSIIIAVGTASQEGSTSTQENLALTRARKTASILKTINDEQHFLKDIFTLNLGQYKFERRMNRRETGYQRPVIVIGVIGEKANIKKYMTESLLKRTLLNDKILSPYTTFSLKEFRDSAHLSPEIIVK